LASLGAGSSAAVAGCTDFSTESENNAVETDPEPTTQRIAEQSDTSNVASEGGDIQEKLVAQESEGQGVVTIEPGVHLIDSPIEWPYTSMNDNSVSLSVLGEGPRATTIKASSNFTGSALINMHGNSDSWREHVTDAGISNVFLDGSGKDIDVLNIQNANKLTFRNIGFRNVTGNGVYCEKVWDATFNQCRWIGLEQGTKNNIPMGDETNDQWCMNLTGSSQGSTNNIYLNQCRFEKTDGGFLKAGATDVNGVGRLYIDQCKFHGERNVDDRLDVPFIDLRSGYDFKISDSFLWSPDTGIKVHPGANVVAIRGTSFGRGSGNYLDLSGEHITVSENYFEGTSRDSYSTGDHIVVQSGADVRIFPSNTHYTVGEQEIRSPEQETNSPLQDVRDSSTPILQDKRSLDDKRLFDYHGGNLTDRVILKRLANGAIEYSNANTDTEMFRFLAGGGFWPGAPRDLSEITGSNMGEIRHHNGNAEAPEGTYEWDSANSHWVGFGVTVGNTI
jgi:hypothetical protein